MAWRGGIGGGGGRIGGADRSAQVAVMRLRRRGSVLRRRRGEAALEGDESGSAQTGLQLRRRGAAAVEEIAVRVKKKERGATIGVWKEKKADLSRWMRRSYG